ncbi:MAG TPA: alpha-galactosidase [Bacillota bacterium]|jgi:alpha-galactosidase|nr:alpha-galactosidase [Bacillota bacterium]HOA34804.1 alpha-galactosidase [Bacillota bacterium]HOJ83562.1 alpha-galactosidase [Bacillota bacterium]HOL15279.1 alpha-galactosidase [Bacillota bacterium]HPZ10840.1 alpha-galactosidase [Bacillota bacterium]
MFSHGELAYVYKNHKYTYHFKDSSAGLASAIESDDQGLKYGRKFFVDLKHSEPIELQHFKLELEPRLQNSSRMMVNGFQSWSGSGEMSRDERIPPLFKPAYFVLAPYGDYRFYRYPGRRGRFHSWTYTYFALENGEAMVIGSLDERGGYTLFDYDYNRDRLVVLRDCQGALSPGSYPLLRLYIGRGKLREVLEEYFGEMGMPRTHSPRVTGWCSWYNYYTRITEEDIRHVLKGLSRCKLPLDYFQIDDGWQSGLGDWLQCNDKFPSGMAKAAAAISDCGFQPGLWLAPFICDRRSKIYQDNPEWLLKDSRGRPVKAGYNPNWSGWFYALDFYAPGFQDYLDRVLEKVQQEWGYRLLKLDFLYAVALLPRLGKPRSAVMIEAMEFIRARTKGSKLLGCGVPLGPAMGRVDYCRIGSDVGPFWDLPLKGFSYRERISTGNSLKSTIGRHHLDRLVFRNDPDVFILRDGSPGVNLNRLTGRQRSSLFFLNQLLGGLIFFSDDPSEYTPEQLQLLRSGFPGMDCTIESLENQNGLWRIEFTARRRKYLALANLTARNRAVSMSGGPYFHPDYFVIRPETTVNLGAYETTCFYKIEPRKERPYLVGATGHIYPGAQIEKLIIRERSVTMQLHEHASADTWVYFAVPRGTINLNVNKVSYPVTLKNGLYIVTVHFEGGSK